MQREKVLRFMDTIVKLLRRSAYANVRNVVRRVTPEDLAHMLALMNKREQWQLFTLIEDDRLIAVMEELDPQLGAELLTKLPLERNLDILQKMSSDDAAEILRVLPEDRAQTLLAHMAEAESEEMSGLLSHDEDTAGGIMTTDFFALSQNATVREAIDALHEAEEAEMVFYLYVTDDDGKLVGVQSLRSLLISRPNKRLADIMIPDVVRTHTQEDQEEVARLVARYNLLALPVVDENDMLVGIVTVDDVIDVMRDEATEDILKLAGTGDQEIRYESVFRSVRARLPWLLVAWLGGLLAVNVISIFQDTPGEVYFPGRLHPRHHGDERQPGPAVHHAGGARPGHRAPGGPQPVAAGLQGAARGVGAGAYLRSLAGHRGPCYANRRRAHGGDGGGGVHLGFHGGGGYGRHAVAPGSGTAACRPRRGDRSLCDHHPGYRGRYRLFLYRESGLDLTEAQPAARPALPFIARFG